MDVIDEEGGGRAVQVADVSLCKGSVGVDALDIVAWPRRRLLPAILTGSSSPWSNQFWTRCDGIDLRACQTQRDGLRFFPTKRRQTISSQSFLPVD